MHDSRQLSRQERAKAERDQVLSWASRVKLTCETLNDGHHLKIGDLNFFPSSGKITRDGGSPAGPERGAGTFISLVAGAYGKPHEFAPDAAVPPQATRLRRVL